MAGFVLPTRAIAAEDNGAVQAKADAGSVSIGNDALRRTFAVDGGKVRTASVENLLGGTTLTPGPDSEEFVLEGMGSDGAPGSEVRSSALDLADNGVTVEDAGGSSGARHGKVVSFAFKPVAFGAGQLTVTMRVAMYDGDHFMRKWLEVSSTDPAARIKYIDGEHLDVSAVDAALRWTVPTDKGGVVLMDASRANLGQPIYVDGMFVGSEFPETDTQIVDGLGRARYWTGKNFGDFGRDGQLDDRGVYVSWPTVLGATRSDGSDMDLIQSDFFSYIDTVSQPNDFRIQYNSWFDYMMRIDDTNILDSFQAIDKHLSETGVRPLDSYVVDDGWNLYRKDPGTLNSDIDLERNGADDTKVNKDGFWSFNEKFPDGLAPSSSLVRKLGSDFGVWVGPRGGYNYFGQLADIVAAGGNGSKAGGSIDVADQRYVDRFEEMAVQWNREYGVNYWKWDGFADNDQYAAFPQGDDVVGYDEAHHHMYGGPNGVFHATDLWEKWIRLFKDVRSEAEANGTDDLWISLTCYTNPSPWFLQWANSVWIQCVGDRGEVHNGSLDDKMNSMLTYRDGCYHDFVRNHQFQFPLASIYNHDPIFGREGTGIDASSMTGAQFANYLYMMGTRGTAFWELYYSDALMDDEKYLVNAAFLSWAEDNFDLLRNAKLIGGMPSSAATLDAMPTQEDPGTQEAYGFACFGTSGDEGIVSMRNPSAQPQTVSFTLDSSIGAKAAGTWHRAIDHAYTQDGSQPTASKDSFAAGEAVSMTLQPGETQVWHLRQNPDATAPTLSRIYLKDAGTVRVQSSEPVTDAAFKVAVGGKDVALGPDAVRAYADGMTFDIALPSPLADGSDVEVTAATGADPSGNPLAGDLAGTFHADGVVATADRPSDTGVSGPNGFTVAVTRRGAAVGTTLASQDGVWDLSLDADGKARFTVGGVTAVSDVAVPDPACVVGVRENNGTVKVYVNGVLGGSAYDGDQAASYAATPGPVVSGDGVGDYTVWDRSLGYDEVPSTPSERVPAAHHAVTFVYDDGATKDLSVDVVDGAKVDRPDDPSRDGYRFDGWKAADGSPYDFDSPVTGDLTLTASWSKEGEPATPGTDNPSGGSGGAAPADGGASAQKPAPNGTAQDGATGETEAGAGHGSVGKAGGLIPLTGDSAALRWVPAGILALVALASLAVYRTRR